MKRILRPGVNCTGIYGIRKSGLIVDGHDYYHAFYEAAGKAKRSILLAGWQFDSDVRLLRGKDAEGAGDMRLLHFLNRLCEENPELNVYILAWDFSDIYLMKREWFQERIFKRTTSKRLHFRFDDRHAVGASHHEKFAVVDGAMAFAGGMDICAKRWDDRRHLADNPYRRSPKNDPYEPYHDTQSFHAGPAAQALADIFKERWENSGGGTLDLPPHGEDVPVDIGVTVPVHAEEVAISRTRAQTIIPRQDSVREIRSLYIDAVGAAEELVYIENQYFTSEAVYRALVNRLKAKDRSKIQIVLILPKRQHAFTEAIALGLAQAKMLKSLKDVASGEGHSIGIYYALANPHEREIPVYIHSKLMVVDDRFMTLGSANTTNRSMGLDTELNVSWEAHSEEYEGLTQSIRAARTSLLMEHAGLNDEREVDLESISGLVKRLDDLADSGKYRLRRHTMETIIDKRMLPRDFHPEELMLDPEKPILEENVFELISHDKTGVFSEGISLLSDILMHRETGFPKRLLRFVWRRWWVPLAAALLLALLLWLAFGWPGH